jgi:nifR3 family TIM-barrel protein
MLKYGRYIPFKMKFPDIKGKALLSPLAGVSDAAFRELARSYGAALTYTEFVNAIAVVRGNEKTKEMLKTAENEKPSAVQIFGTDIPYMTKAAKFLSRKFDIIDINCGCPAVKLTKTGAGAMLMKNPKLIGEIISSIKKEVKNHVTVKIRAGVTTNKNAVEVAKIAEKAGASAITVHGRTLGQGYGVKADWDIIKKVKKSVGIPVIGNGDVDCPEVFKKRLAYCDAVMIGRAAMKNPYIFRQINDFMKKRSYDAKPYKEQLNEYLNLAEKHKIEFTHVKENAIRFTKGVEGGARLRDRIMQCKSMYELRKII